MRRAPHLVGISILLLTALATPAVAGPEAGGPRIFAVLDKPVGMAFTTTTMLVTTLDSSTVYSVDSHGVVTVFAQGRYSAGEHYIAVASGPGECPAGDVYIVVGQSVYQISSDGQTETLLATIPSLPNSGVGITFDGIGRFDFDLILTDPSGPVWTLTCSGVAAQLDEVGGQIRGPAVAPLTFGQFGGDVLVAGTLAVYSVSPSGLINAFADIDNGEQVVIVPTSVCSYGASGAAYFVNVEGLNEILEFPAQHYPGQGRPFLVTRENGSGIEGSAFAPCPP